MDQRFYLLYLRGYQALYRIWQIKHSDLSNAVLKLQIYSHSYSYFNRSLVVEKGLGQTEVERLVDEEIMKIPEIAAAMSSRE